jgi:hypothetical protein
MKALWLVALLVLGLVPAAAACTVTTTCSNACFVDLVCPPPRPPCEIGCSSPNQTLTCTGAVCGANSTSVTCDGVVKTCSTNQCKKGGAYVQCGNFFKQCPSTCQF